MIIDDKVIMLPPPPSYPSSPPAFGLSPSPFASHGSPKATLSTVPAHILLQIIHHAFPSNYVASTSHDSMPLLQRRVLFWLSTSLRLVSRNLFTACMHILRSTYLQSYMSFVRPPYTTDPFPLTDSESPTNPPAYSTSYTTTSRLARSTSSPTPMQRETPILDLYIALKVRQDVFSDDTELHIEREEAYKDLFDVAQPRARLEDLVREYGIKKGIICVSVEAERAQRQARRDRDRERQREEESKRSSVSSFGVPVSPASPSTSHAIPSTSSSTRPTQTLKSSASKWFSSLKRKPSQPSSPSSPSSLHPPTPPASAHASQEPTPLLFPSLSVQFTPRKIGLVYNRRTILEVARAATPSQRRAETLESLAWVIVEELREVRV